MCRDKSTSDSYSLLCLCKCFHICAFVCVSVRFNGFNVSPLHTDEGRRCDKKLCVLAGVNKVD